MSYSYFFIVTEAILVVCGIGYAVAPHRWLKRQYGEQSVPEEAVKRARVLGVVISVAALAFLVFDVIGLLGTKG